LSAVRLAAETTAGDFAVQNPAQAALVFPVDEIILVEFSPPESYIRRMRD
jgi:hypothetical protein